ncbi:cell wall hydrolase [Egbenema bharatensis]|uniref:cell wall hydrolase n=1 Tax=Egbenema bharatensis TaxID=3463334 RepID=UPI003A8B945F
MFEIYATQPTVIKRNTKPSHLLSDNEKFDLIPGANQLKATWQRREGSHYKFELLEPFKGAYNWYAFVDHVRIINKSTDDLAEKVVRCCKERGYPLHSRTGDINLIGIEGMNLNGTLNDDQPDQWNDLVGILSFSSDGSPHFDILCQGTTEPSIEHTVQRQQGVARLDTGYHKGLWQVGIHRGYEALAQNGNTARLVRDRNRNHRRDDAITYESSRGINLHTTKTTGWRGSASPDSIGPWSAGCVVIYKPDEFLSFMKIIKQSRQYQENRAYAFDFVLLWSRWLVAENQPVTHAMRPTLATAAMSHTTEDIDIMARTIWGEARGESREGKVAVAWVIRNRAARSPAYNWPSMIKAVCRQAYQFSCWNHGDPNRASLQSVSPGDSSFRECLDVAKKVTAGELSDNTNGADHYYNPAGVTQTPDWARGRTPVARIGRHLFFRLVGR